MLHTKIQQGENSKIQTLDVFATYEARTITCVYIDEQTFRQIVKGPILAHLTSRLELSDNGVRLEDINVERTIGVGGGGVVKIVTHKKAQTRYALKIVNRKKAVQRGLAAALANERNVLIAIDHPFVMKLVRTFRDKINVYFLTELCTGGELLEVLDQIGILAREQVQFYSGSLVLALEYLRSKMIVYRDLKPENILLDGHGFIKMIDFGVAKKLDKDVYKTFTVCGTPQFMAPEVILGKGYSFSCDVWSFGIVFYELVCGILPFGSNMTNQADVLRSVEENFHKEKVDKTFKFLTKFTIFIKISFKFQFFFYRKCFRFRYSAVSSNGRSTSQMSMPKILVEDFFKKCKIKKYSKSHPKPLFLL